MTFHSMLCTRSIARTSGLRGVLSAAAQTPTARLPVMGTAFATGHAAGVAAELQTTTATPSVKTVQDELRRQGALL